MVDNHLISFKYLVFYVCITFFRRRLWCNRSVRCLAVAFLKCSDASDDPLSWNPRPITCVLLY